MRTRTTQSREKQRVRTTKTAGATSEEKLFFFLLFGAASRLFKQTRGGSWGSEEVVKSRLMNRHRRWLLEMWKR